MEHIIQQITGDFIKKFIGHFAERGLYDLGIMTEDSLEMCKDLARSLIAAFIADADRSIADMKAERRKDGIAIRERNVPRTLQTALGEICFKRTYFDTPSGGRYPLDAILGINAYERADTSLSARAVNLSAGMSFAKSAAVATGGALSRQTVRSKAMGVPEVAMVPKRADITPETIHIFADEDHVHMQSGRNAALPLVTICSGKEAVCKGRNALTDPIHIKGYGLAPAKLWEYVYAVCAERYDLREVKSVYIYGDGAKWIAASEDVFPYAVYVLDAYHYEKRMRALTAGAVRSRYAGVLRAAISANERERFEKLVEKMRAAVAGEANEESVKSKNLKSIAENAGYITSHWESIQNMKLGDSVGSCTEGLVSHVFSERFSRNPMGWSEAGLSKMSGIRVFIKNGEKIKPSDIGAGRAENGGKSAAAPCIKKYEDLVRKQQREVFARVRDWGRFERDVPMSVAPSGTKVALDALGRMRKIG